VLFGPLGRALQRVVEALDGSRLWILLDEWSSVPLELQPLLADLLRRSLFPIRGLNVKIATIERRTRFREFRDCGDYLGIEVGADVAAGLDLDHYLIFDLEDDRAQAFFRTLMFNHMLVRVRQPEGLGRALGSPGDFVQAAFKKNAFAEFVRAAEGVPRDAINLAALAARYADNTSIGISEVRKGGQGVVPPRQAGRDIRQPQDPGPNALDGRCSGGRGRSERHAIGDGQDEYVRRAGRHSRHRVGPSSTPRQPPGTSLAARALAAAHRGTTHARQPITAVGIMPPFARGPPNSGPHPRTLPPAGRGRCRKPLSTSAPKSMGLSGIDHTSHARDVTGCESTDAGRTAATPNTRTDDGLAGNGIERKQLGAVCDTVAVG
jgi:hypothetical protein